jgi:hypothetical protein
MLASSFNYCMQHTIIFISSFLNSIGLTILHGYKTSMGSNYLYAEPDYPYDAYILSQHLTLSRHTVKACLNSARKTIWCDTVAKRVGDF